MFGFLFPRHHLSSGSVAKNSSYHLLVSPGCGCGVRTLPVCFAILKTALPDLNPAMGGTGGGNGGVGVPMAFLRMRGE